MKKLDVNVNKYYTPTIDEFYVGFEYEYRYNHWEKRGYFPTHFNFTELDNLISLQNIRVKYLDKTDIESLGFKEIIKDQYHFIGFMDRDVMLLIDADYFIQIINKSPDGKDCYLFQGTVKNKSELVKLIKMLGINE